MCGNDHIEVVWTLRVRESGQPYQSEQGYNYIFDTADEARDFLANRDPDAQVEIVQVPANQAS